MADYLLKLSAGLPVSLGLTVSAALIALLIALTLTVLLALRHRLTNVVIHCYLTLFTGTPLLVQIFLIYYGPGQFPVLQHYPTLWSILSQPGFCAVVALSLNSAAYTTQLLYGAVKAIPAGQWQSCYALGMTRGETLKVLLPYAFKRALSSYSNEVVLVFKSTSLAYTITLMDVMGLSQQLYGGTYDVNVFIAAGIIYLCINGLLTLLMRAIEAYALRFERRA